jgi:hypothetical protein
MAIRDHFRVDVLVRVAADQHRTGLGLADVERLPRPDDPVVVASRPDLAENTG